MKLKPLSLIDFYKADHRRQYPKGTEYVSSNFTPRSGKLAPVLSDRWDGKVVFFGLQYYVQCFLIDLFNEEFFGKDKATVVRRYKRRLDNSLGQDAVPVDHIEALHDLGYLPICIRALPEGVAVPVKVPMLTISNTHPAFFWLVSYLETVLSATLWKMCTSATIAREYKQLLYNYAMDTGSDLSGLQFQAHDFSFRGMSCAEDAAATGAGHLLSFAGTDCVPAIDFLEDYYGANSDQELVGCSVPATEHSVMCMGTKEDELGTFRRLITELYPKGVVSIVSDTWDFWKVVTEYSQVLRDVILERDGKVVLRPDSGDPVHILTGYRAYPFDGNPQDLNLRFLVSWGIEVIEWNGQYLPIRQLPTGAVELGTSSLSRAEVLGAVECLWRIFGGTTTSKGYKMLDGHIGLIYGDSITLERAEKILSRLEEKGFASGNVVFGVGSYTYQHVTRDCFGFAVKSTYGVVNGECREIFKDPVTDNGTKRSAKGLLRVDEVQGEYVLTDQCTPEEAGGELAPVFIDGVMCRKHTFREVKERMAA